MFLEDVVLSFLFGLITEESKEKECIKWIY